MQRCAQCGSLLEGVQAATGVSATAPGPQAASGRDPFVAALLSFLLPGGGQMYNEQVVKGEAILLTSFLLVPWAYGIVDAYRTASRMAPLLQVRSPGLATLLAHVMPGAGQAYNRQWGKALLVFVTSPFILPWLVGIVDAYRTATRINAGLIPLPSPPSRRTVVLAVAIALAVLAFLIWLLVSWKTIPVRRFPI
jgi:TM2 domain-containing membrane protein YozV